MCLEALILCYLGVFLATYVEKLVWIMHYLPELVFETDVIFVGTLAIVGFLATCTVFFSASISVKSSLAAAEASLCLNKYKKMRFR